jgi:integrase
LVPTHRGFLTAEELERLEQLSIDSERLKTVRNLFIFSCYTGISYADLMLLTEQSVVLGMDKTYWIITKRQKTGNAVKIPLLSKAFDLIKHYMNDKQSMINGTLFSKIYVFQQGHHL